MSSESAAGSLFHLTEGYHEIVFLFGSLIVAVICSVLSGGAAHAQVAAPGSRQVIVIHPLSPSMPAWITEAMPYVHVSHGVATIDPAIVWHLTSIEYASVKNAVEQYNTIPSAVKINPQNHPLIIGGGGGCTNVISLISVNWWGIQFYFNDCLISNLSIPLIAYQAAVQLVSLAGGLIGGLTAIVANAILSADYQGLVNYSKNCNYAGAYLNISWLSVFWPSSVC